LEQILDIVVIKEAVLMKKTKIFIWACVPALALTMTACSSEGNGNRIVIKEPGKTITVIDDASKETGKPDVAVAKTDLYENVEISDWLSEDTVIVSKENKDLGAMKLAELADSYPRSLYVYNLATKQYEPLKEQANVFLGEASLSPDKKHLLYSEFTLGDPVYYVMNLDTLNSFGITGNNIGGAMSAKWTDNNTVIGAAYSGGAYTASIAGEIAAIAGLDTEGLVIVEQINDKLYYTSNSDESLMMLDLATKEPINLGLEHVYRVIPAPDGKQMLVLQANGSKMTLLLSDTDGNNQKTIAEGTELGGVSWSADQRMIAYNRKADANGTTTKGLYVFDMLSGKSTQLAVDVDIATTTWSPSGEALVYTQWDGKQYNSSIIHLTYSLQK
jgi:TolB protein